MNPQNDRATQLMDDMDPALLDFVKTRVTSFIRWELLRFLHENPGTADSAENIAQYTGRSVDAVRPELDNLVESGVMAKRVLGRTAPAPSDAANAEPAEIYVSVILRGFFIIGRISSNVSYSCLIISITGGNLL